MAQGLRSDRVAVEVYERDRSSVDRLVSYPLRIGKAGRHALQECLPRERLQRLIANGAKPGHSVSILDHWLNHLLALDLPHDSESRDVELPVSRIALRRVLVEGLEPVIRFGKGFVRYDDAFDEIVSAHFDDGSTALGDVLVGADGANSLVRAQLLPQAGRIETGIIAISGRRRLDEEARRTTPSSILRGPTLILGPRGRCLAASTIDYDDVSEATLVPQPPRYDRSKYVTWSFSARRAAFHGSKDVLQLSGAELKELLLTLIANWHPALGRMVRSSDPGNINAFPVKTSTPIEQPWPTRNVTLLGDALHNMTPFRGSGANAALRDAAALRRVLVSVDRGEAELIPALAAYERDMIAQGFAAVRASLRDMECVHAERWLPRLLTRMMLLVLDRLPLLKRAMFSR